MHGHVSVDAKVKHQLKAKVQLHVKVQAHVNVGVQAYVHDMFHFQVKAKCSGSG